MNITVAIAVYNGAATLHATLESVFRQTLPPREILVVNDGSTDATSSILRLYRSRITVIDQENKGLSGARNVLCKRAQGDVIAFLDADDVWHPQYLETQHNLFESHPNAMASFTGHVDFRDDQDIQWDSDRVRIPPAELIRSAEFIKRYTRTTGLFASPSYCCVPRTVLRTIGQEPFDEIVRVCDDAYLFYLLALKGPVLYTPTRLVGYRLTPGSLSSNRLRNLESGVQVFELLEERYRNSADPILFRTFQIAFAAKRREFARVLIGGGQSNEARLQLRRSLQHMGDTESLFKGLILLLVSYIPQPLQPTWPSEVIR
jgi:glycosyltransferase involved in cell wall biosynthesis